MTDLAQRRMNVNDIEKQMVKCRYCHQDVQFGVLPLHQYFCQKAQNQGNPQKTGSPQVRKIMHAV